VPAENNADLRIELQLNSHLTMGFVWHSEIDVKLVDDPMNMLRPMMEPIRSMVTLISVNPGKAALLTPENRFQQPASYKFI